MGSSGTDDQAERLKTVLSAPVVKRSVMIAGHASSVSIEKPFWEALKSIAKKQGKSLNQIVTEIDKARGTNLSSAIRLYVLNEIH